MTKKHEPDGKDIEPGMAVEATKGDLGEEDVSKPKVTAIVADQQGDVEKLFVHKGVIFKKTLEIPADRIQSVDAAHTDENTSGKVTVEVSKQEAAALTSVGFETIKKIFIVMSLAFATYFVTALFSHANWGAVLLNTFVPHLNFGFASISSAVALLGATISLYTMFWQVQGEKEEQRSGSTRHKVRGAALDIALGVISGNLVSYFIIHQTCV